MNETDILKELAIGKQREKELREQIDELNDFIENAALPLHWVNGSGIIIWANKIEMELLGYTRQEYIGRHISNFHADKEIIEDILSRLINKETLYNYGARLKCKNGEIRHVLINSNVLWKNGEFVHTRCFTRDITDLKKSESDKVDQILRLEEKNKKLQREIELLKNLQITR